MRRRSSFVLIGIIAAMIGLLFFNDETSLTLNMEYQQEINNLRTEIKANRDSAEYYRRKREDILAGRNELEHLARERFHMQRPTEDVYVVN